MYTFWYFLMMLQSFQLFCVNSLILNTYFESDDFQNFFPLHSFSLFFNACFGKQRKFEVIMSEKWTSDLQLSAFSTCNSVLLKNPGAPLTNRSAPGFFSRCQRRFLAQKLKKLRCFFGNKFHKIKERKLYGAKILTKNHKKKTTKVCWCRSNFWSAPGFFCRSNETY